MPGVGEIEMSSSVRISTTLSPTKRKKRRKKVKTTKKNETPIITDTLITITTLGEVDIIDIEEDLKKIDRGHFSSDSGNQVSQSSANEFNFVLPNLGEVILTNLNQVDIKSEKARNNGRQS